MTSHASGKISRRLLNIIALVSFHESHYVTKSNSNFLQWFSLVIKRPPLVHEADPKNPKVYTEEDLVTHFTGFGKAHNIVANEKTNLAFNVGGDDKCSGKLWAFDVKDPANPKDLGCSAGGSYVHDAQCINYDGPDSK